MTTKPDFKRRTLVKAIAASSLLPILGSNLIACSDNSNYTDIAEAAKQISVNADDLLVS